jgi:hypothetical protein
LALDFPFSQLELVTESIGLSDGAAKPDGKLQIGPRQQIPGSERRDIGGAPSFWRGIFIGDANALA